MMDMAQRQHLVDVCVVGGGMAGLCAAVSAARNGARTLLVHDRPVLGGNASSEVRMWICGAHGELNKETGLLEEIQLENLARNPGLHFSIWDSVLWQFARGTDRLTTLLNASCCDGRTEAGRIRSIRCWQLTTQTWHEVQAGIFIDCSGESVLAPISRADIRVGREAAHEYHEPIEPPVADHRTMGNTLLIQIRKCQTPQPYTPPAWAYKFTRPEDLPHRMHGMDAHNFWWIELGGLQDTIADAETVRDELMRVVYGVWDYIKNHAPEREKARNWTIEWIGSLPGKRENRRYLGPHVLTQHDIEAGGPFEDIVAYGGWSMDDHHPAGLLYPGKPTLFHPAPSPYGIPYRCIYSRNIDNLLFAGRNISVTHAALSSTRVMATCALLGQAAGTAAALCQRRGLMPAGLYPDHVPELQATLQEDDCWLPGRLRPIPPLTREAALHADQPSARLLLDGVDRDRPGEPHAWEGPPGSGIELRWPAPVRIRSVRIVLDSDLRNDKRMPCSYPQTSDRSRIPRTLLRDLRIDALDADRRWQCVLELCNNHQRLLRFPVDLYTPAIRLTPLATHGHEMARVLGFEVSDTYEDKRLQMTDGPHWSVVVGRCHPDDLARPPLEDAGEARARPTA